MVTTLPPTIPFVEAYYKGGKQIPSVILLRSSHTSSTRGAALGIANMWHKTNSPVDSCHYVVDEGETYQCVPDRIVANHSNSPRGTWGILSINVCSEPIASRLFWDDSIHTKVLDRTADLVADLLHNYRIPARYLISYPEPHRYTWRRRSKGGIVLNVIGDWPEKAFLADVLYRLASKKSKSF